MYLYINKFLNIVKNYRKWSYFCTDYNFKIVLLKIDVHCKIKCLNIFHIYNM